MSTPTIRRISSYGHVEIEWPKGQRPTSVMVASEILDGWADTMNEIAEIRRTCASITVDDIAAVLPSVSTGRAMGDWTEPDHRHTDAEWIRATVIRAATARNQVAKHPDTPDTGNRNTAPLPPPKPGTHESDLPYRQPYTWGHIGGIGQFIKAQNWSRANV